MHGSELSLANGQLYENKGSQLEADDDTQLSEAMHQFVACMQSLQPAVVTDLNGATPAERKSSAALPLPVAFEQPERLLPRPGWPASGLPGLLEPLADPAQPHTAPFSKQSETSRL